VKLLVRRLLSVLIVLAIIGGPTSQPAHAAHSVPKATMEDMPCDMGMSVGDMDHGKSMMPCKDLCPDCMRQMCCVANAVLPVLLGSVEHGVPSSTVSYWSSRSSLAGMTRVPEPLPPRTI
jgi:hypothetical protein